jgi:antitoxin MazE
MKTQVISIGDEFFIPVSKSVLNKTGLKGELEIQVQHKALVIRPANAPRAREGWEEAFEAAASDGADSPFIWAW